MTATELLDRVRAAGGEIEARGDRLKVRAPAPLCDGLLAELRIRKPEILTELRQVPLVAAGSSRTQGDVRIAIEALTAPDVRHCCACGKAQWWTRSGRRICRVCHPPPFPECEE